MPWLTHVAIDRKSSLTLSTQISRAIAASIREGKLPPGTTLPSSRALAAHLRLHRNTIVLAYRKLAGEGWITTKQGSGTAVSRALPEASSPKPIRRDAEPGYLLRAEHFAPFFVLDRSAPTLLDWGVPDARLFPAPALARAYRRALRDHPRAALDYARTYVHPRLREAIAAMLSGSRALHVPADSKRLMITRGSQMALDLIARVLVSEGDVVACEDPGYEGARRVFGHAGAALVGVPVDNEGICVDSIRALAERKRVRIVFVTPHHQYPTTVRLSARRRIELRTLAAKHRFAIVEDDYDHEFHYDGGPVLPLSAEDREGVTIYVGSLSKVVAPGLRIGFVVAPARVVSALSELHRSFDRQSDRALDMALADLFEEGEIDRHIRKARIVYRARRDALSATLVREFRGHAEFTPPSAGLATWIRFERKVNVRTWAKRALAQGIAFRPGGTFFLEENNSPAMRIGFAARDEETLASVIRRLARLMPRSGAK